MLRLARSVASQRALSKALAQRRGVATVSSSAGSKEQDGRSLEAMTSAAVALTGEFPAWLRTEMRTNHAGEFGAVEIYTGALYAAAARSRMNLETDGGRMRLFAEHHMATEQAHLDIMLKLVPASNRTRLLPIWRAAALSLGFFPALAGPRCLYWTVASVETFVEEHYQAQIMRLREEKVLPEMTVLLERLCAEEVHPPAHPPPVASDNTCGQ
ncbi:ubiquinone biosynthesis protein COQ7-domain-containing protein [Baffinella frigidus]|nr:ubiquinone biosynthesis protein COQ7-domain-containing protein [Cryptophyta sp. CCMP2293]